MRASLWMVRNADKVEVGDFVWDSVFPDKSDKWRKVIQVEEDSTNKDWLILHLESREKGRKFIRERKKSAIAVTFKSGEKS